MKNTEISTTVIIPTIGTLKVRRAVESVLNQTIKTIPLVVVDGIEHEEKTRKVLEELKFNILVLPENTGANKYYGHRIYAGIPHIINTKYISFLDEDCWYEKNHIKSMKKTLEKDSLDWVYSLRRIIVNDEFYCNDDCESLGKWNPFVNYNFVDTNCYFVPTENLVQICNSFHGKSQQDRKFYFALSSKFKNFDTSGMYTVNYDLHPTEYFKDPLEFFKFGNEFCMTKYKKLPWRK